MGVSQEPLCAERSFMSSWTSYGTRLGHYDLWSQVASQCTPSSMVQKNGDVHRSGVRTQHGGPNDCNLNKWSEGMCFFDKVMLQETGWIYVLLNIFIVYIGRCVFYLQDVNWCFDNYGVHLHIYIYMMWLAVGLLSLSLCLKMLN